MNENLDPLINLMERLADPNIHKELKRDATTGHEHLAPLVPADRFDEVVANLSEPDVYAEVAAALRCIRNLPAAADDPGAPICWSKLAVAPEPGPAAE